MNDELNILIAAMLDENKSIQNINTKIKDIQSKLKTINISLNIGDISKDLEKIVTGIEDTTKRLSSQKLDFGSIWSASSQIRKMSGDLDSVYNKIKNISNVKSISEIFDAKGNIEGFAVQIEGIENGLKKVENFKVFAQLNKDTQQMEYALTKVASKTTDVSDKLNKIDSKKADQLSRATNDWELSLKKLSSSLDTVENKYGDFANKTDLTSFKSQISNIANLNPQLAESKNIMANLTYEIGEYTKRVTEAANADEKQLKAITDKNLAIDKLNDKLRSLEGSKYIDKSEIQRVTELKRGLEGLGEGSTEFRNKLKEVNYEVNKLIKYNNELTQFSNTLRTIGQLFVIGSPIMLANQTFREMVSTINELNSKMTDIRIVTGMSAEGVKELRDEYNELGKSIGATTTQVMDSAIEFIRQGRSISDTQELINSAVMGAKLSGTETASMTDYLTTAVNGYNVAAKDSISIIDKLVAVDNSSASSMAELSIAMSRTAKSAQLAGVSIDDLISYIGTISSVTRKSAETVGESLKSIFSRYQNIKLGQFVDDGVVANDVRKALGTVKIELMETEDEFKGFSEVLDELTGKWGTMSTVQKSAVANAFAGVRQRENFLVLMDNMSMATDLATKSTESGGLALDRYNIYLESTEAKLNTLKTTLEEVFINTLNSDTVNNLIELATGVLELTNNVGGLIPVLASVGIGLATFKNVGGANILHTVVPVIRRHRYNSCAKYKFRYRTSSVAC